MPLPSSRLPLFPPSRLPGDGAGFNRRVRGKSATAVSPLRVRTVYASCTVSLSSSVSAVKGSLPSGRIMARSAEVSPVPKSKSSRVWKRTGMSPENPKPAYHRRSDSLPADRSLNLGACFTDYEGSILREEAAFSGAYLDPVRGTLKVTDVDAADWPPVLEIFPEGVYHLYDYQFFYRNLQENVRLRTKWYLALRSRSGG